MLSRNSPLLCPSIYNHGIPDSTVILTQVLKLDPEMQQLAESLRDESSLLVFGRGYNYATALEAALKARPQNRCPGGRSRSKIAYISNI